jgi:hypothetical protein
MLCSSVNRHSELFNVSDEGQEFVERRAGLVLPRGEELWLEYVLQ